MGLLFLGRQTNSASEHHFCPRTQLSFALRLPKVKVRREGAAGPTALGAAQPPHPTRAISPHRGSHSKLSIYSFSAPGGSYLNFIAHDSFPKGVPVWEGEWRDGAVCALDRDGCCQSRLCPLHISSSPLKATSQIDQVSSILPHSAVFFKLLGSLKKEVPGREEFGI